MDVMRNSLETYFVLLSIISSPWSNIHCGRNETLCSRESLETHIYTFYHLLSSFYWVMAHLGSTESCHWFYVQFTASVSASWVPGTYLWKRIFTGKRFRVPRPRKSPCFAFFPSFVIIFLDEGPIENLAFVGVASGGAFFVLVASCYNDRFCGAVETGCTARSVVRVSAVPNCIPSFRASYFKDVYWNLLSHKYK